ncbi:cytochrome c biogenesis protein CcdA, partial [Candidatus Nanopelagicales bacterium]|nr:cytochrome c biogenesis protein CcdA [Candidatus Nanopelagicales bacterium]
MLLAIPLAFLAGLVSFLSPCVLPLAPGYLAYVTGLTGAELTNKDSGAAPATVDLTADPAVPADVGATGAQARAARVDTAPLDPTIGDLPAAPGATQKS